LSSTRIKYKNLVKQHWIHWPRFKTCPDLFFSEDTGKVSWSYASSWVTNNRSLHPV